MISLQLNKFRCMSEQKKKRKKVTQSKLSECQFSKWDCLTFKATSKVFFSLFIYLNTISTMH